MFFQERNSPSTNPKPSEQTPGLQAAAPTAPPSYPGANFYSVEFVNQLEKTIQKTVGDHSSGALIVVSITNLAMIINAYGHDTSEVVMHDLMKMIEAILPKTTPIERLQRDQLGVVLANTYPEDTASIAQRIHTITQNFGRDSFATASLHLIAVVGSVNFPLETGSAHDALDKAYVAINSGQIAPCRTFEMTRREADVSRQQMGLANYLLKAFKEQRLRLAFQPVIESKTGKTAHYEALFRLISATGKISSGGALIPIAEKMGLIDMVDTLVMEMVIEELRHSKDVVIAFNVSNLTTENAVWLDHISQLIKETPEIASRLIIELTETAVHRDLRRAAFFVASLQSLGCQVALDDFGSGYTSFRQLKALSVDMVKIDGVFVKDLAHSTDNRFFVKTLLDFSRAFGLKTVAEFVETGEIAKILMEMGVDYLQGYYFGKPENHRTWLNEGEYKSE
jgi:EAL domain-containing protein (putative c-di-GMP-specific phosphodiesterase class I)/GGDEF domain-containing protein